MARVPEVRFAYLFGSTARGDDGPLSDIDLAVFLDEAADPFETRLSLIDLVTRRLGDDRVDVVVLNTAPVALAGRVLASRQLLFERDAFARHRYESRVMREFADFRVFERRHFDRRYRRG